MSKKKHASGKVGIAEAKLDKLAISAEDIQIDFEVDPALPPIEAGFRIRSSWLVKGWGFSAPNISGIGSTGHGNITTISQALRMAVQFAKGRKLRFETIRVKCKKAAVANGEIATLVKEVLADVFDQAPPDEENIAAKRADFRAAVEKTRKKWQEIRERWAEERKETKWGNELKRMRSVMKKSGKPTDFESLCTFLPIQTDMAKFKKAKSMLKAEKFQLYFDLTGDHLEGIVKSQGDPKLIYGCRLEKSGSYGCCTQNLNVCGGLKGCICKHLMVLILGLVKAGRLDAGKVDKWVIRSRKLSAALKKEAMSELFLKYKGAEAGDMDWRPTETLPEDYYAV